MDDILSFLRAIAADEPVSLVRLRKGDLLHDMKDDFNAMLQLLEEKGYVLLQTPATPADTQTPAKVGITATALSGSK
jgi:hypothetical protein